MNDAAQNRRKSIIIGETKEAIVEKLYDEPTQEIVSE
jgi:hypothetical protein